MDYCNVFISCLTLILTAPIHYIFRKCKFLGELFLLIKVTEVLSNCSHFLLFMYCTMFPLLVFQLLQSALKGMQYFLNGGKWKAVPNQDLGTLLAVLKVFILFYSCFYTCRYTDWLYS